MDTPQAATVNHISLCAGYGGIDLLGNGVDPDVVAKAFVTLYNRLNP